MIEQTLPFLRDYDLLRLPIVDSEGSPVWPEIFPLEKIDELRETVGPRHFSSQMMLEYIAEEKTRLDPGALKFYSGEFDLRAAQIKCEVLSVKCEINNDEFSHSTLHTSHLITGYACYWDPSGGRKQADCSVCVLLYRDDKNRRAFIHDAKYLIVDDSDLHPLATQCDRVLDFMAAHNLRVIAIEVNGIGNALPEILRECAAKRSQPVAVQKIINHQRKEIRILDAIEPLLTTGRLFAHERIRQTQLLSEMLGWAPVGAFGHDDGLDALAGALRIMPTPIRTLSQNSQPLRARTEFKI